MRASGGLDYFAALPIHRAAFVLAIIAAFFVLGLPSLISTLLIGAWFLGLQLQINIWLLPVIVLSAIPFASSRRTHRHPLAQLSHQRFAQFALHPRAPPPSAPSLCHPIVYPHGSSPFAIQSRHLCRLCPRQNPTRPHHPTTRHRPHYFVDRRPLLGLLALVTRKMDWRAK